MKHYYLYMLLSKNGTYYVGSTQSKEKRLMQHNSGKVRSTKSGGPWKMIYAEDFDTLSAARRRELQIKSWKSRSAIERLVDHGPIV